MMSSVVAWSLFRKTLHDTIRSYQNVLNLFLSCKRLSVFNNQNLSLPSASNLDNINVFHGAEYSGFIFFLIQVIFKALSKD